MAVIINGTGDQTVYLDYNNYKVGNCSARSEGNNAYLNVKIPGEDIRLASNFTIEGWFYLDPSWATTEMVVGKNFVEINGDPSTIVESQDGIDFSSDDPDFWFGYFNDQASIFTPNPVFQVGFKEVDSEANHQLNYYWEMPTEQWIHIAVVRNNNQIRLYINGQETTSAQYSGNTLLNYIPVAEGIETSPSSLYDENPNAAPYVYDTNVKIGLDYHGNFDEFRIRNGAMYTANFTPSTTPFEPSLISDILLLHFDGNFEDDVYNVKAESALTAAFSSTIAGGIIIPAAADLSASTAVSVEGGIITLGELSMSAAATQTTSGGMVYGGEFEVDSAAQQTVEAAVTYTGELALDGVLSADVGIVGLLGGDIVANATFSADVEAGLLVVGDVATTATTNINIEPYLILGTTVAVEATTTQTTDSGNIIRLVYPFNWETHPTWDEWTIWQNTYTLGGTFEQITEGRLVNLHEAEIDLSLAFAQTTNTSVQHNAALDVQSSFESYVSVDGQIPGDVEASAAFNIDIDTQVTHTGVIDLTAASTFESSISGFRPGDIDVNSQFAFDVDARVDHYAELDISADTTMSADLSRLSDAEVVYQSTFTQTTDAQINFGTTITLNTEFATDLDAQVIRSSAVELSSEFATDIDPDLFIGSPVEISSEFAVEDITPFLFVNGSADWTALTATAIVAFVESPDPCRTLSVKAETRTLNIKAETRTLALKSCSIRRVA